VGDGVHHIVSVSGVLFSTLYTCCPIMNSKKNVNPQIAR